ncbi:hypothetical protein LTH96_05505 [Nesterenkonia sp. LB17]|nr:hypothetical protein [Nesterenkonia sp. LB17]
MLDVVQKVDEAIAWDGADGLTCSASCLYVRCFALSCLSSNDDQRGLLGDIQLGLGANGGQSIGPVVTVMLAYFPTENHVLAIEWVLVVHVWIRLRKV